MYLTEASSELANLENQHNFIALQKVQNSLGKLGVNNSASVLVIHNWEYGRRDNLFFCLVNNNAHLMVEVCIRQIK